MSRKLFAGFVLLSLCGGLVACSSGGTGTTPPPIPTPVPTGTPTPTAVPAPSIPPQSNYAVTQTGTISVPTAGPSGTPAPIAIPVPSALPTGYASTITVPSSNAVIPANTVVQTAVSNQQPSGIPTLSLLRRPNAVRTPRDSGTGTSGATIEFVTLAFTQQVTFPTQPTFSFTLPSQFTAIPNVQFWIAAYDPLRSVLGWQRAYEGPGTVSGTTIAFTPAAQTTIFYANQPVYFALYAISTAASTPTPAPSVAPAATPAPLAAAPSSLEFTSTTDAPKTIAITDAATSYTGGYTATSADPTVARVSITGTTATVTPVANGFTAVTIVTADHRQVIVPVGVTTTSTTVQ